MSAQVAERADATGSRKSISEAASAAILELARGGQLNGASSSEAFGLPGALSDELSSSLIAAFVLAVVLFVTGWLLEPLAASWWATRRGDRPNESVFPMPGMGESNTESSNDGNNSTGNSRRTNKFPSLLSDGPEVDLSVVIVAQNEEARLSILLDDALAYLHARAAARGSTSNTRSGRFKFEIIVADMGSSDRSRDATLRFCQRHGSDVVRLLQLSSNIGRGGAARKGVLRARGQYILVMDAEGDVPFDDISRLEAGMQQIEYPTRGGQGVVFGSHAHCQIALKGVPFSHAGPSYGSEDHEHGSAVQQLTISAFRVLFQMLCVADVYDTQCPFKLFSRNAARRLFASQHMQSLGADCELLFLARKMHIPIKEQAVQCERALTAPPLVISTKLLRDLVVMRLAYLVGVWSARI